MSSHFWFSVFFGFIGANIALMIFNCVGMGIMVSQMDDFFANKRTDLFGPPPPKTMLLWWACGWLFITAVIYVASSL